MPKLRAAPSKRAWLALAIASAPTGLPLVRAGEAASEHPCCKANLAVRSHRQPQSKSSWRDEYDALLATGQREALEDTDVLHCDLQIEILPDQHDNLVGTNTLTVQSKSTALTQFTVRLRSQFLIDKAVVNGAEQVEVTTISATTRVIALDRVYGLDEVFTLRISYHGHAESRGFGSIEFAEHEGQPVVYSLSQPYFAYTWWPAKDGDHSQPGNNRDKFTLDLSVVAPEGMVSAGNGKLISVEPRTDHREQYHWSSGYPISTYLVCFASTNYNTYRYEYVPLAGGTMPVDLYLYPEHDNETNRAVWARSVDMLYTLRNLFGEYPFVDDKYGIYEVEFAGGMEHQTFAAQGVFSESLTVHELAHQWWGDAVTCATWHDIWLNEGLATYTEALWAERKPGSPGLTALRIAMSSKKYFGAGSVYVTAEEMGSLYDIFDTQTTYKKAAWVFHMLRHVLGDDRFFDALAAYRAAFEHDVATTADFQDIIETVHGHSLDWFFQQWVYGERTPTYAFGYEPLEVNGRHYLALYLQQIQPPEYQRFTMPIDVRVDSQTFTVFNDHDPEHFVLPLDEPPGSVSLDPLDWVLRGTNTATAYVPGPPTVVESFPAPGQNVPQVDTLTVTFHTAVDTVAEDYVLEGEIGGPQALTVTYDPDRQTAILQTSERLGPDVYTLTISDAMTALDSGLHLDGETNDPSDPASLPTGEGLAGGSAVIRFIVACEAGDGDCDGDLDLRDFGALQRCYLIEKDGAAGDCSLLDFQPDGQVNLLDMKKLYDGLTGPQFAWQPD